MGVALVIIPGIVDAQVGSTSQGMGTNSLDLLVTDINRTCSGDVDTETGTVSLNEGQEIILQGDEVELVAGGESHVSAVACELDEEPVTITVSGPYYVRKTSEGYEYR